MARQLAPCYRYHSAREHLGDHVLDGASRSPLHTQFGMLYNNNTLRLWSGLEISPSQSIWRNTSPRYSVYTGCLSLPAEYLPLSETRQT